MGSVGLGAQGTSGLGLRFTEAMGRRPVAGGPAALLLAAFGLGADLRAFHLALVAVIVTNLSLSLGMRLGRQSRRRGRESIDPSADTAP